MILPTMSASSESTASLSPSIFTFSVIVSFSASSLLLVLAIMSWFMFMLSVVSLPVEDCSKRSCSVYLSPLPSNSASFSCAFSREASLNASIRLSLSVFSLPLTSSFVNSSRTWSRLASSTTVPSSPFTSSGPAVDSSLKSKSSFSFSRKMASN